MVVLGKKNLGKSNSMFEGMRKFGLFRNGNFFNVVVFWVEVRSKIRWVMLVGL